MRGCTTRVPSSLRAAVKDASVIVLHAGRGEDLGSLGYSESTECRVSNNPGKSSKKKDHPPLEETKKKETLFHVHALPSP